jgi:hypothetical protein
MIFVEVFLDQLQHYLRMLHSIVVPAHLSQYHGHVLMHVDKRHLVLHLELPGDLQLLFEYLKRLILFAVVIKCVFLVVIDVNHVLSSLGGGDLHSGFKLNAESIHFLD